MAVADIVVVAVVAVEAVVAEVPEEGDNSKSKCEQKMKKITTILFSILLTTGLSAQTAGEALTSSQQHYEGTARTLAMGNAFTALGGDLGAIAINPASSAIYRYSQFSLTPSFITSNGETNYLNDVYNDSFTRMAMSNLGFVMAFDTGNYSGLLNYNFGITLNRNNSFNAIMTAYGITDQSSLLGSIASGLSGVHVSALESTDSYNPFYNNNLAWPEVLAWETYLLANTPDSDYDYIGSTENIYDNSIIELGGELEQSYYRKIHGGTNAFSLNFGGNFSDFFYFGANLNLLSLTYELNETYGEKAINTRDFQDGFESMTSTYWQRSNGSGVNFQVGAIVTPIPGLRVGASFTSPTWFDMTDNWQRNMKSSFVNGNYYDVDSPVGAYNYRIRTPMRWSVGAAFTFGNRALVSADYENVNYSKIWMADNDGNREVFSEENNEITRYFKKSDIIRVGAEVWPLNIMAIRVGYNYYSSPDPEFYDAQQYISGGVGFKFGKGRTTLDIAYRRSINNSENFTLYNDYSGIEAPLGVYTFGRGNLLFTFGFKF